MKKPTLLILLIVFASCKTASIIRSIPGQYYKKGKDYTYELNLNDDYSFTLAKRYFEVNSTCQGKWQHLSADTILLRCNDKGLDEKLQSGYMIEREKKVVILTGGRIKVDKVILNHR